MLFKSTTFQFCILVLFISGLAAGFTDDLTWKDWLKEAVVFVGIYASKEGIRYGAAAYENGSQ